MRILLIVAFLSNMINLIVYMSGRSVDFMAFLGIIFSLVSMFLILNKLLP